MVDKDREEELLRRYLAWTPGEERMKYSDLAAELGISRGTLARLLDKRSPTEQRALLAELDEITEIRARMARDLLATDRGLAWLTALDDFRSGQVPELWPDGKP